MKTLYRESQANRILWMAWWFFFSTKKEYGHQYHHQFIFTLNPGNTYKIGYNKGLFRHEACSRVTRSQLKLINCYSSVGYLYEKLVSIVLRKAFEISRTCWCWLDRKKKFTRLLHSALCFNFDHELKQEEAVGEKTKERPTITCGHPC